MSLSTLPTAIHPETVPAVFSFNDVPLLVDTASPTSNDWVIGSTTADFSGTTSRPLSASTTLVQTADSDIISISLYSSPATTFQTSSSGAPASITTTLATATAPAPSSSSPVSSSGGLELDSQTLVAPTLASSISGGIETAPANPTIPASPTIVPLSNNSTQSQTQTTPAHTNAGLSIKPNLAAIKLVSLGMAVSLISSVFVATF